VDWINLMTYDMGGGYWGHAATHNTPLDGIQTALSTKWSVFPPEKVCIGLANYGYLYHGLAPGQPSAVPLRQKGRSLSYSELPKLLSSGWKESYDPKAAASYYFSPDRSSFATIDTPTSIKRKLAWISSGRFRGVFWWEYHLDYVPSDGSRANPRHLLIDQVSGTVGAGSR
jgi:chitinase